MSKWTKEYQNFFLKSDAGQNFMQFIAEAIETEHSKAEDKPELARDHTQRAKGYRGVSDHINSVIAERNKPE